MNLVSQYGPDALNLFLWIRWVFTDEGEKHICKNEVSGFHYVFFKKSKQHHTFLSQFMTKEMFVRGEEPISFNEGYPISDGYKTEMEAYENHQSLFEGYEFNLTSESETEFLIAMTPSKGAVTRYLKVRKGMNKNDFLIENKGLKWNPNKKL